MWTVASASTGWGHDERDHTPQQQCASGHDDYQDAHQLRGTDRKLRRKELTSHIRDPDSSMVPKYGYRELKPGSMVKHLTRQIPEA
jgi:hypothetical protein